MKFLRYWTNAYIANMKVSIAGMLQYRFAVLIWALWGFVAPLISLAVWSAAAEAKGGSISNAEGMRFAQADFAAYFLVFMIYQHLIMSWDAFEFAWRVRDGNLSPRLLKPINPIHADACNNIAFKIVTSAMLLPVWIGLFVWMRPTPPTDWRLCLLSIPALFLAGVIRYVLQYCLAMIAFWTTRTEAINQFYFTLDGFLSGRLAPLALLPGWFGIVATYTPFRYMAGFPVELALGRVPYDQILPSFLWQIFWLVVVLFLFRFVWARGIKQYSAVGA